MNVIWRILGFHVAAEAARRLPPEQARRVTLALLVAANLLPIVGVWEGWMTAADVFLAYWLESAVIGVLSTVRILTAAGERRDTVGRRLGLLAVFVFLFGLLTLLHGLFLQLLFEGAAMLAGMLSELLGWGDPSEFQLSGGNGWVFVTVGLFVSHLVALVLHWFIRGERHLYGAEAAMWLPFPRVLALQLLVSIDVFVLIGLLVIHQVILVVLLVAVKLVVDLAPRLVGRIRIFRRLMPSFQAVRDHSRPVGSPAE